MFSMLRSFPRLLPNPEGRTSNIAMSGSHYSINTLSSAEIPLIHVNKAPSHSQASLQSGDTQPLSVHSKNARTFRQSRSNTSLEILTDVLFALFSAVFFVYGIYVARYNGKPVADHTGATNALINATKIVCAGSIGVEKRLLTH